MEYPSSGSYLLPQIWLRSYTDLIMHLARTIVRVVLAVALAAYAFDCSAATTPEQAMQCCHTMRCASHAHHGMDCCKNMPTTHVPFVRPSTVHGLSFSPIVFALVAATCESDGLDSSARSVAALCHAPPIVPLSIARPLRV